MFLFIFKTEREREGGWVRERGRHRFGSRRQAPSCSTEPDTGLKLTNREIMTQLKSDAQPTEPPGCPHITLIERKYGTGLERSLRVGDAPGFSILYCYSPAL